MTDPFCDKRPCTATACLAGTLGFWRERPQESCDFSLPVSQLRLPFVQQAVLLLCPRPCLHRFTVDVRWHRHVA